MKTTKKLHQSKIAWLGGLLAISPIAAPFLDQFLEMLKAADYLPENTKQIAISIVGILIVYFRIKSNTQIK